MIELPKYFNPETNSFEPDLSSINIEKWAIKGYALNEDNESYKVELEWISHIPFSITPAQGRMQLVAMGLFAAVKSAVNNSTDEALAIFWEYALSWDRENIHIAAMAGMMNMSEHETDTFFIQAKKI